MKTPIARLLQLQDPKASLVQTVFVKEANLVEKISFGSSYRLKQATFDMIVSREEETGLQHADELTYPGGAQPIKESAFVRFVAQQDVSMSAAGQALYLPFHPANSAGANRGARR